MPNDDKKLRNGSTFVQDGTAKASNLLGNDKSKNTQKQSNNNQKPPLNSNNRENKNKNNK